MRNIARWEAEQATFSTARYSEIDQECHLSFAPLQRTVGFQVSEAVMSVTLAATRHYILSNGRSAFKQEVESLCLKLRNPAEKFCADQPVTLTFRLRQSGGPYMTVGLGWAVIQA